MKNSENVDDLVVATKTKNKEGFYDSKNIFASSSKSIINPANDVNIQNSYSKKNLDENNNLKENGNFYFYF